MNKYIDADKLIAEIEKRQEERQDRRDSASWENEYWPESDFYARDDEDKSIIAIVDSLQQERSEVDFDEEFNKFHIGMYNPFDSRAEIYEFARHFAEWGATHLNIRKEE